MGQKTIYIGSSIWNSLPDLIKKANILSTLKDNVKKHHLTWITHDVFMWICVSVFIYAFMSVAVCIYLYAYILVFSFDLSILMSVFFSFTHFSHCRSDLRGHNENKAFLPVLCYPSHCWCYSYILTFNQFVCLFVCLFLLRLIFRLNKFVIFQALYSFLWLVFMTK